MTFLVLVQHGNFLIALIHASDTPFALSGTATGWTRAHGAMKRAAGMEAKGFTYSYDMLGEAARTEADAARYFGAAEAAAGVQPYSKIRTRLIHTLGIGTQNTTPEPIGNFPENPAVGSASCKALNPRLFRPNG